MNFQFVFNCQEISANFFLVYSAIRQAMMETVLFETVHSAQPSKNKWTILCWSWSLPTLLQLLIPEGQKCLPSHAGCMLSTSL